jgi:heme iron utilization protein
MNRLTEDQAYRYARDFIRSQNIGTLNTQFLHESSFYPLGAMTPYALTTEGEVLILISEIALHTKNIRQCERIGFSIMEHAPERQQAASRLSFIGRARMIEESDPQFKLYQTHYYALYPEASHYHKAHQFYFCVLTPEFVHYVRTFGQIFSFAGRQLILEKPEFAHDLEGVLSHMNQDHQAAIMHYAQDLAHVRGERYQLVNICSEGMTLKVDYQLAYIPFPRLVVEAKDLRSTLTMMAKRPAQAQETV